MWYYVKVTYVYKHNNLNFTDSHEWMTQVWRTQLWHSTTTSCSRTALRSAGLRNSVVRFGAMYDASSQHYGTFSMQYIMVLAACLLRNIEWYVMAPCQDFVCPSISLSVTFVPYRTWMSQTYTYRETQIEHGIGPIGYECDRQTDGRTDSEHSELGIGPTNAMQ